MRRATSRRATVLASSIVLAMSIALPGTTLADKPQQFTDRGMGFSCPIIESADGAAFASGLINENFSESQAAFWLTPPVDFETEPDLFGFGEAVADAMTLSSEMPLEDTSGTIVGIATYEATLTPIGKPERVSETDKGFRLRGTEQMASVDGTLVISADILSAPVTFDLSSCFGFIFDQTTFIHDPDTQQDVHDEIQLNCALDDGETTGFLDALTFLEDGVSEFGFADIDLTPDDPTDLPLVGDLLMDITGADSTFPLFNPETGETLGEATLTVSFTVGETSAGRRVGQDYVQKMTATELGVEGNLAVTVGEENYDFALDSCDAFLLGFHNIFHDSNGPRPSGKTPANDLPSGATPLAVGGKIQQSTGGAAIPPEAPCFIQFRSEVNENSWGRTVWFSVEGTGDPVTIDPAGSNFDTVVAAYTSELEHLGCVDDDFADPFRAPQSPLTIDTVEGETYLIQVGGFDAGGFFGEPPNPEFGRLRLAIR